MTVFCENTKCKFCSKRRIRVKNGYNEEKLAHTCTNKWLSLSQMTNSDFGYEDTDVECEPNCFQCLSFKYKEEVNDERD